MTKSNDAIFVIALLALNFGVLMLIAQMRIPLEESSETKSETTRVYLGKDRPGYLFPSCSAGNLVNCHTKGNLAGL